MCWVDACVPATRLNIDRWPPAARQICSDEVPTLAQRSASIIYTITGTYASNIIIITILRQTENIPNLHFALY